MGKRGEIEVLVEGVEQKGKELRADKKNMKMKCQYVKVSKYKI